MNITLTETRTSGDNSLNLVFSPIIQFPVGVSASMTNVLDDPSCIGVVANPSLTTQITIGGTGFESGTLPCLRTPANTGYLSVTWIIDQWAPVGSSALFGIAFELKVDVSQQ